MPTYALKKRATRKFKIPIKGQGTLSPFVIGSPETQFLVGRGVKPRNIGLNKATVGCVILQSLIA